MLDKVRWMLANEFGVDDIEPVKKGDLATEIRAELLAGWSRVAEDPDWAVIEWLRTLGVPAGLRLQPADCGNFPRTTNPPEGDPEALDSNPMDFTPYSSVEQDDEAWHEVQRLVAKKWLKQLDSLKEVEDFLGEKPVLSKFGQIIKVKLDKIKRRLILDSKSSGVSEHASKLERVILPRLLDVVFDILSLMDDIAEVELLVLDFADAFWLLPLSPSERKWFVSMLRGKYFVFEECTRFSKCPTRMGPCGCPPGQADAKHVQGRRSSHRDIHG